jgi:hypothetical protein
MRIRPVNPHAQSKDLYTLIRARLRPGVLPFRRPTGELDRVEHECRITLARVGRTLLSDAFDFDFDFDREGHEFHSCRINVQPGTRLQGAEALPKTLCHPDRSRSASDGAAEGPAVLFWGAEAASNPSGMRPRNPTLRKGREGWGTRP